MLRLAAARSSAAAGMRGPPYDLLLSWHADGLAAFGADADKGDGAADDLSKARDVVFGVLGQVVV